MHPATSVPLSLLFLAAASLPASAQLSGSVGSSNAANRSFQLQNQIRSVQRQQTFDSNQTRMRMDSDRLYSAPGGTRTRIIRPR